MGLMDRKGFMMVGRRGYERRGMESRWKGGDSGGGLGNREGAVKMVWFNCLGLGRKWGMARQNNRWN